MRYEPLSEEEKWGLDEAYRIYRELTKGLKPGDEWPEEFTVSAKVFDLVESAFGHLPACLDVPLGRSGWKQFRLVSLNSRFINPRNPRPHLKFKGSDIVRGDA